MSGTLNQAIYDMQLLNQATGESVAIAGGTVFVCLAGTPTRATLLNADTGLALANPLTPVRGRIRFMVAATIQSVDLYGMAPSGEFFVRRGVEPGGTAEIMLNSANATMVAVIPFNCSEFTAGTEYNWGLQMPATALVQPDVSVRVTTAEAGRTLSVGLLSSESGGNASGFITGLSLAAVGRIKPLLSGTPTLGALLVQNFATTPAVNVRQPAAIAASRTISITTSASSVLAAGFIEIPYLRPII